MAANNSSASMTFQSGREELDRLMTDIIDIAAASANNLELTGSERVNWGLNQTGVFTGQITIQTQAANIDATAVVVPDNTPTA